MILRYFSLAAIVLFVACGDKNNNSNNDDVANEQEINQLDSSSQKLENAKNDIEESAKKLDDLLENL